MKKSYLLSLAVLTVLFTGCGTTESTDSAVYVESDTGDSSSTETTEGTTTESTESTTADGTTSSTVVTTSDNVVTTSNYSSHNQGTSCAKCHSTSSGLLSWFDAPKRGDEFESDDDNENEGDENEDGENIFTSGATVFAQIDSPDYDAKNAAYGYTLRLILQGGEIQGYNSGRGTGNFNGTFNAGIDKYTAQVLDSQGNIVNTSATDSHDSSRFDCNSCHTAGGNSGAPGRIVAYSLTSSTTTTDTTTTTTDTNTTTDTTTQTVTDPVAAPAISFANDVLPILDTQCASCHGGSGSFTITNSTTPYAGVVPFVDTANATGSSLLQKGSGTVGHAGGAIIQTTSSDYATIRDWISAGALDN